MEKKRIGGVIVAVLVLMTAFMSGFIYINKNKINCGEGENYASDIKFCEKAIEEYSNYNEWYNSRIP